MATEYRDEYFQESDHAYKRCIVRSVRREYEYIRNIDLEEITRSKYWLVVRVADLRLRISVKQCLYSLGWKTYQKEEYNRHEIEKNRKSQSKYMPFQSSLWGDIV
jgi:hypothetical protein